MNIFLVNKVMKESWLDLFRRVRPKHVASYRTVRKYISIVLSHHEVCGHSLQQPWETDRISFLPFLSSPTLTYLISKRTLSASPVFFFLVLSAYSYTPWNNWTDSQGVEFITHLYGENRVIARLGLFKGRDWAFSFWNCSHLA